MMACGGTLFRMVGMLVDDVGANCIDETSLNPIGWIMQNNLKNVEVMGKAIVLWVLILS